MQWITDNLYTKLIKIFFKIDSLFAISMPTTTDHQKTISELKRELYKIYKVKRSPFGQISIKTYHRLFRGLYYDYPQDDPLKDIPPSVDEIESKQPPAPPSSIRKLEMLAITILAIKTTSQIVQAVREGMPLKEAVLVAIQGITTVAMAWAAKEGLAAMKERIKPTVAEEEEVEIEEAAEKLKQAEAKKRAMEEKLKQAEAEKLKQAEAEKIKQAEAVEIRDKEKQAEIERQAERQAAKEKLK